MQLYLYIIINYLSLYQLHTNVYAIRKELERKGDRETDTHTHTPHIQREREREREHPRGREISNNYQRTIFSMDINN
jgi:hypothetical protein